MFSLTFFGDDGEFSYVYSATIPHIVAAFRVPRLYGLTWTFDGDGWSSNNTLFPEADRRGSWYITWVN